MLIGIFENVPKFSKMFQHLRKCWNMFLKKKYISHPETETEASRQQSTRTGARGSPWRSASSPLRGRAGGEDLRRACGQGCQATCGQGAPRLFFGGAPISRLMQCHVRFLLVWRRERSSLWEAITSWVKQPPYETTSRPLYNLLLPCNS
jgi:hypothetical protein